MPEIDLNWDFVATWGLPLAFLVAGALVGLLFERFVLRQLGKVAQRTSWRWDDIAVDSVKRAPIIWFTALGAVAATHLLPLSSDVVGALDRVLFALIIFSITLVVARIAAGVVSDYARRSHTAVPATSLVTNVIQLVIYVGGLLFILQSLGVSIMPLITTLGIGGLAVALALQPTLANVFAGFQIIASRQVRQGDYIRLEQGEEGYVTDIKWRNTTIKALWDDHEVVVPNSKLGDSVVINYHLPARSFWVKIDVGVHYDSDLERVEEVVQEVAKEVSEEFGGGGRRQEPVVRFREFGDSSINLIVRLQVDRYATQFRLRHEFIKRLHRRFGEERITIPFPIRTLHTPDTLSVRREAVGEA
jgi:small-conductance mechanosensitive channel